MKKHGKKRDRPPEETVRNKFRRRGSEPAAAAGPSVFSRLGTKPNGTAAAADPFKSFDRSRLGPKPNGPAAAKGPSAPSGHLVELNPNPNGKRPAAAKGKQPANPKKAVASPAALPSPALPKSPVLARLGQKNTTKNNKPQQVKLVMISNGEPLSLKTTNSKTKWLKWLKHINQKSQGSTTAKQYRDVAAEAYINMMERNKQSRPTAYSLEVHYPDGSSDRYMGSDVQQLMIELSARVEALNFFHSNDPTNKLQKAHKSHYDKLIVRLTQALKNATDRNATILRDLKVYLTQTEDGRKLMSGRA